MTSVHQKLHGFIIKVYDSPYPSGKIVQVLRWSGFKFDCFRRWQWYFRYRTALCQVQHPKSYVDARRFEEDADAATLEKLQNKKLSALRAKVTKWRNVLKKAEREWSELFPIGEDKDYQRAVAKLKAAECELENLENQ